MEENSSAEGIPRDRWPWLSLIPLGLGAWAPIIGAVRWRHWWWIPVALLWTVVGITGIAMSSAHRTRHDATAGLLMLLGWGGGIATSFALRRWDERRGGILADAPQWPSVTERSRTWRARYGLVAYVATFVAANAIGAVLRFGLGVHFSVGAGVLIVDGCLLGALVPLARRGGLDRRDLGLRTVPGPPAFALALLGLLVYAALSALWILLVQPHSAGRTLAGAGRASGLPAAIDVLAIAISAPVVEEIFFRGVLYRSLRNRLAVAPAVLVAGCLFGLVHIASYPLVTLPVKAAFGMIACLLYERTRSLLPGIALHCFVDAIGIDVALTGNGSIALAVAGGMALLVLGRASLRRRTAKPGNPSVGKHAPTAVARTEQVEPVRRSGHARGGSWSAVEQRGERLGSAPAGGDLEHRAD